MSFERVVLALLAGACCVAPLACGDDDGGGGNHPLPMLPGVPDAGADTAALAECQDDGTCDDLNPCNGVERCEGGQCTEPEDQPGAPCARMDGALGICRGGQCAPPSCGDGALDEGEGCDDGELSATCNLDCTQSRCGDGVVNPAADEACDDRGASPTCTDACLVSTCGDGVVNPVAGEQCDARGRMTASCDSDCTRPECGDGVRNADADEACDDGGESRSCDADCSPAACGDGTRNRRAGEACDDGGESADCDRDCSEQSCGDGLRNASAGEECDDEGESASCDADCTLRGCGDGTRNATALEQCDDGADSTSCDADCTDSDCGDGYINTAAGETCDDQGESASCDADCTAPSCGDGLTNTTADELCDDAGESDTCDADCTAPSCGDGLTNVAFAEQCDDGADGDPDDGCDDACQFSCEIDDDCPDRSRCTAQHVCEPPHWRLLAPLVPSTGSVNDPILLTLDGAGKLVVAWSHQHVGGEAEASYAISPDGQALGARQAFEPTMLGDSFVFDLATDMSGQVIAALSREPPSADGEARVATLSSGNSFGAPVTVGTTERWVSQHTVGLLAGGAAFSAWLEPTPNPPNPDTVDVYGAVFDGTWRARQPLEGSAVSFSDQAICSAAASNGVVSVAQEHGLFVARVIPSAFSAFDPVVTLNVDQFLDWPPCGDLAIAPDDDALLVWTDYLDQPYQPNTQVKIYDASMGTWGPPIPLEAASFYAYGARTALSMSGDGLIAFVEQEVGGSLMRVRARPYDATLGLLNTVTLYETSTGSPYDVTVGLDDVDGGFVAWAESMGSGSRIAAVRYEQGAFSSQVDTIDSPDNLDELTRLSVQPDGRAAIAWIEDEEVHVARFE